MLDLIDIGALAPEQETEWLWTYVDTLETRVARDWKICGPRVKQ